MELYPKDRVYLAGTDSFITQDNSTKKGNSISLYSRHSQKQIDREVNSRNYNATEDLWETKCPPKLSLAEMVFALPHIIERDTKILEKNYQSESLCLGLKEVKPRILLIENRDDSRKLVASILRLENFQVIEAKDSNVALNLAKTEHPQLIICELMMPTIDGYGILHFLRQSQTTKAIPLLFITFQLQKQHDNSGLILVSDEGAIETLTTEKLLAEISKKLRKAISRTYNL